MSAAGRVVSPAVHLLRSGIVPARPDRAARALGAVAAHGGSMATLLAISAALDPDHPGLTDHRGTMTSGELWQASLRLAAHLAESGVGKGDAVAIVARNHRGFVIATMAASRSGADVVLVNTEMSAEQYKTVLDRHRPAVVIHDPEFAEVVERACADARRIPTEDGPTEDGPTESDPTGKDLAAGSSIDELLTREPHRGRLRPVHKPGRLVLLTSGTTGTAKSAPRSLRPTTIGGLALSAVTALEPRRGEHMYIASPFFHGFGLLALLGALGFGNSIHCLAGADGRHLAERMGSGEIDVLAAVPAQLHQALEANGPRGPIRRILTGASPVPVALTRELTEKHGSCVVVGYGSTEAGIATLAGPAELAAAPGTVGPAVLGLRIRILREDRTEAATGETGTIFVRGAMRYDGYSGTDRARDKELVDGFLNTGDLGHLDEAGRLFVAGREDDMIVTGGENVFATEVEAVIADLPAVADAAVGGVEDDRLGTRMRAYLVLRPGTEPPTLDQVKAHVRTRLERYKSPREVVFVAALPRNPSGKLQRFRLPELEILGTATTGPARGPDTDPDRPTPRQETR